MLVVSLLATGLEYGVDRERYVAANEAILQELPTYPGARQTSTRSSPYYEGDSARSPAAGYVTLAFFELPQKPAPEAIAAFYEQELASEWELARKIAEPSFAAGPILDFRRGKARVSVNLESWRARVLEIAVDHRG